MMKDLLLIYGQLGNRMAQMNSRKPYVQFEGHFLHRLDVTSLFRRLDWACRRIGRVRWLFVALRKIAW